MGAQGIVLSAGLSSRAGTFKMELPLGNMTMVEKTVEGMAEVCSKVFVVAGYQVARIERIFRAYPKVEVLYNKCYPDGMFSSIKEGIKHISEDRFFIMPGDCPMVGSEVYKKMLEVQEGIVIPVFNGINGHPVLLADYHIKELLYDTKYTSMQEFIINHSHKLVNVEDEGILMDVDTIEDYRCVYRKLPGLRKSI
jgi:molybdenum cofactor cytidylyltransferase